MRNHGKIMISGILKSTSHYFTVFYRRSVITYSDCTCFFKLTKFSQPFSFSAHCDGCNRIDPDYSFLSCLTNNKFRYRSIIVYRISIRHTCNPGKSTGSACETPGFYCLFIFLPRLSKMNMHINKPGNNHLPVNIQMPDLIFINR